MPVQLICASHSPLMTAEMEESQQGAQAQFFSELQSCATALHKFNPDLVVVFGPDHFNGFFYELMPAFCIGSAAEGTKDWHLEGGPLKVPRELAVECVRHLQSRDFDVALSHAMKVDHGITIPLYKLTGALARYPVLPVFINCAADPRPSFRRVRAFGGAIGEFLAGRDMRITVIGSGGLSHDPPTPRIDHSDPGKTRRLIDRDFLDSFIGRRLHDFDAMTDAEIDRVAGFGAHEVRTWVAAAAAAQKMGDPRTELRYYHLVPEWITGMGIVAGQA
jgi:2,3-dihydroxyphenylpropionate 1,2-dioxygenase